MGKYDNLLPQLKAGKDFQTTVEVATLLMLQKIANELAEANRLKRLDLEYMDRANKTEIYFKPEVLEDQA